MKISIGMMIILCLLLPLFLQAQTDHTVLRYYAASYNSNAQTISFYSAEDIKFTLIGSVAAGFEEKSAFKLSRPSRVTLSPNGKYVALVGIDTISANTPAQLRVYDLSTQQLITDTPIPLQSDATIPSWSPNSEYVLTQSNLVFTGTTRPTETLIYSVGDNRVYNPVANRDFSSIRELIWTPDNLLIFNEIISDSEKSRFIWLEPSDGSLADIKSVEVNTQRVCELTWSPFSQRWYFIGNCTTDTGFYQQIYSFAQNGDVRQEADLSVYDMGQPGFATVLDVQATDDGIYTLTGWASRILQIPLDGKADMVAPVINSLTNQAVQTEERIIPLLGLSIRFSIAPNNEIVALIDFRYDVTIATLTTSEILAKLDTSSGIICNPTWLDNTRLIYSTFENTQCIYDNYMSPTGIRVWDISNNVVTMPLGESSWLLPIPYTEMMYR